MGGFNSGNHGGKRTTAAMRALDIRKIQRDGFLSPGSIVSWGWTRHGETVASVNLRVGSGCVTLDYRSRAYGGEWQDMNYPVWLSYSPCNYGGQRAWWLCPAAGCGRRVAVLYGGQIFACRHCHRLAYASQREAPHDRAARRADKLRKRLGWDAGILNGDGYKPKGMHWQTFDRLTAGHDAHVHNSLAGIIEKFGLAVGRLEAINRAADKLTH